MNANCSGVVKIYQPCSHLMVMSAVDSRNVLFRLATYACINYITRIFLLGIKINPVLKRMLLECAH